MLTGIDRTRLATLMERERHRFIAEHPLSERLAKSARESLIGGVPMGWMTVWDSPFPPFIHQATGARLLDVDGREYIDFCLGEGGAMTGHAPPPVVDAIARQAALGLTHMLPTTDALWVSDELTRRFGLPFWHFALSATDANRFALRLVRELTGRRQIVVFSGYYHGTLDEAPGNYDPTLLSDTPTAWPPFDTRAITRIAQMNDLDTLESALAGGDVACVLMEPALTNVGIVLPEPGFHAVVREMTRRAGTLLILDESHTLAAGPGGCTSLWDLQPDVLTVGKAIGSGVAAAAYGFSAELAAEIERRGLVFTAGAGGTMAGNPLSMAAMRATLEHVLTEPAYAQMTAVASRFAAGIADTVIRAGQDWGCDQLGARVDLRFGPRAPRNRDDALAQMDTELSSYLRLHALNRGVALTPFLGNTALMSPVTTEADVDHCVTVMSEGLATVLSA